MHASVQHKPSTPHSMFIKVATADYVSQHSEETKNIYSVICNGASRFEAVLLHALAFFLDSYKSHHRCEQFIQMVSCSENLLWHGRAEKYIQKN